MSERWADIDAVSFDIGGTIVPEVRGPATAEIAALLGVELTAMRTTLARTAKRTRRTPRQLARQLAAETGSPAAAQELEALLCRRRAAATRAEPYPDVRPALEVLRRRGFAIVFLSNVLGAIAPMPDHPLLGLADVTLSSCDTGHVKPEHEAFASAERAIGVPAARIVHVGDSLGADVRGALAAGWRAVHLDREGGTEVALPAAPDRVRRASTMPELLDFLPLGSGVARRSRAATGELAPLDPAPGEWRTATARRVHSGERSLLVLPFAAPVGRSRGQRYRVSIAGSPPRPHVILNFGGRAALAPPHGFNPTVDSAEVRIQSLSQPRTDQLPPDLQARLRELGIDVGRMAQHEVHQLVLMIRESATDGVRAARVDAAVSAIAARCESQA